MQHFSPFNLKASNSFGFDVEAKNFWRVGALSELPALIRALRDAGTTTAFSGNHLDSSRPLLIGGGSNLLITAPVTRPVVQFGFHGVRIVREEGDQVWVEAGAGMPWHELVLWSLDQGLNGLENLSLIPGTVGAAPVQNIGAYGVELKDCFESLQAFDWTVAMARDADALREPLPPLSLRILDVQDCAFGYRDSMFKKNPDWWITSVCFRLSRRPSLHMDYGDIRHWLSLHQVSGPSARDISNAVIDIRSSKLPDPRKLGNAGSFFKNPVVALSVAESLRATHPCMPSYPADTAQDRKLPAAWLIDQCGLKGYRQGDAAVHQDHALVLVNHGHATGSEVLAVARHIQDCVRQRFGISLEPEPFII